MKTSPETYTQHKQKQDKARSEIDAIRLLLEDRKYPKGYMSGYRRAVQDILSILNGEDKK